MIKRLIEVVVMASEALLWIGTHSRLTYRQFLMRDRSTPVAGIWRRSRAKVALALALTERDATLAVVIIDMHPEVRERLRGRVRLDLAECFVEAKRFSDARELVDSIRRDLQSGREQYVLRMRAIEFLLDVLTTGSGSNAGVHRVTMFLMTNQRMIDLATSGGETIVTSQLLSQ